jgi:class 3 adenylate cyclase
MLFAAAHPDRTQALILGNTTARFLTDVDYPWGLSETDVDGAAEAVEQMWGTEAAAELGMPDAARDPRFRRRHARATRLFLSPKEADDYFRWMQCLDVREILATIRVPTLVLHRADARWITPEQGRYLADRIPEAHFVLIPGADLTLFTEPVTDTLHHLGEFLTRHRGAVEPGRALAAVLFTDIVGSTGQAASLGDHEWRSLLESHDAVARTIVDQHQGRLVKTTGDGMLTTFDGPGRAIRCATALRDALRPLGLEIRAGLHTGEVELRGLDIAGIGVHIAARVLEHASAGQLLASAAVPMLVVGSGIEFEDQGEHELKGVPGSWRLFGVFD